MRNVKTINASAGSLSKAPRRARCALTSKRSGAAAHESRWVTAPTLRKILNISSVTLWRWRRAGGFPIAKRIKGRLYFPWSQVAVWLNQQQDAG
jgi:predicted DNA-binding transcriptional regulator AlpA